MHEESKTPEPRLVELAEVLNQLVESRAEVLLAEREEEALERATRWNEVVADLSTQALRGWYLYSLLGAAARLVADNLGAEFCGIFKVDKSGEGLRLVSGVGWANEEVGLTLVGSGLESQAGYTVLKGEPVIVSDLASEERFSPSSLLRDHGVVSGLSVPMIAGDYAFGVMSVHAREPRDFSREEARFMETVANILAIAALRRQAVVTLRQTHRALEETKRYLASVLDTSRDAIVSTAANGVVIHCNRGVEELLGYLKEELLGQPVSMLFTSDEQAEELMGLMRLGGGTVDGQEITLRSKDGRSIPVLTSASIFYDEVGDETGSVRFNRDLRDRERWKDELEKVAVEIEKTQNALEQAQAEADAAGELRRVNEELNRYIEYLKRAQDQLVKSEKMAALGRLTAGVSHEILNPLNVISLNIHVMLNDPDLPPEVLQSLRILDIQGKRIMKITESLIDYASKREPIRRKLDLNGLIDKTLNLLNYDFMDGDITVVQGCASGLPSVWADHDQLQQVLLNLLTNARDAMPEGGRLTLSTEVVRRNGQEFVELRVEDTGSGISRDDMDKIFDPFFTTKPEGEGAGLGLSICQGIVEAHGGSIQACSEEGQGTTITIDLPLKIEDREPVLSLPDNSGSAEAP